MNNEKFLIFTLDQNNTNQFLEILNLHFKNDPCEKIVLIGFNYYEYACNYDQSNIDIILVKSENLGNDNPIAGCLRKVIGEPNKLYVCLHKGDDDLIKNSQKNFINNIKSEILIIEQHHNEGPVYRALLNIAEYIKTNESSYKYNLDKLKIIWHLEYILETLHSELNSGKTINEIKNKKESLIKKFFKKENFEVNSL